MKILGMGNALVDVLAVLDSENLLAELNLPKGSMQLIDENQRTNIFDKLSGINLQMATGGAASNTTLALAKLGVECGFIGKVGTDNYGDFYVNEIKNAGVTPHFIIKEAPSGTAMTLITPDGERTFGTYLGIASELSDKELQNDIFQQYEYFYIEGYLVQNYALIENAVKMAKMLGIKVAIDLASYNVVEANKDFLTELITNYVDIVFANEEEAKALTGKSAEEAVWDIAKITDIAIVKIGSKGSLIIKDGQLVKAPAFEAQMIDATAAGDFYAAGFFYGLINNATIKQSAQIGSLLASNVIEVVGTKLPEDRWTKIRDRAKAILNQ